jgi:hypothetical protein
MQPHELRVVEEKRQLDVLLDGLAAFIDGSQFKALPADERRRLYAQHRVMVTYSIILRERIEAFPPITPEKP